MNDRQNLKPLRATLAERQSTSIAASALLFALAGTLTYVIARSEHVAASVWFSVIFSVAVGMLAFCCTRIWLDENSFDGGDSGSYVVMTGTLSFIAIMLTYITLEVFPFGDRSVLIIDMHHQYVAFHSLLRERFFAMFTGGNVVYSDSLGLGGGFLPLFSYYLSSPFNILMLIFPREGLTEAIALATVLKITAAGVTFSIFARRAFRRNDFSIVVCGLAYSMISFFIGHSWNIMWLDPLILLPLVCLGLELLLRDGKPLLYCITLALALLTNYYIGYMICIFMVLYYLAIAISDGSRPTPAARLRRFWRFTYGSLIGGGMSAVLVIPTYLSLMNTSGAQDKFARELASNFDFFGLYQRMLFSAYPSMRGDNLPNIYCSVLAVLLLVIFLTCEGISLRRRVAWGGVVGFLALSMSVNWLNFAWHGFHFPNDLPYRFSFLMSFAMLCVAMQTLANIRRVKAKRVLLSFGIVFALLMAEQAFGDGKADFRMIYVSLFFFAVYALVVGLYSAGKLRQTLCYALLAIFLFAEVTANASVVIQQLNANEHFTLRKDFVGDYEVDRQIVELVEGYGDDMYRMEILPRKTCNDPSLFGYSGITVFASSNPKSVTTLMGKLGYGVNGVNSYLYKNYTPISDSLLAVKYVVLETAAVDYPNLQYTGNSVSADGKTRYLYQNTAALSRMYLTRNNIITWTWQSDNPYVVQNDFVAQATSAGDNVWRLLDIYASTSPEGEGQPSGNSSIDGYNCSATIDGTFFSLVGDGSSAPQREITVRRTIEQDGMTSVYVDCGAASSITINCSNGTFSSSPNEPNTIDLGSLPAGTAVEVTIRTNLDSVVGNVFLAQVNDEVFAAAVAELQANDRQLKDVEYNEGRISGTVDCLNPNGQIMFTSIPYDSGWRVRIDGERVDTFALGDALLCFRVPEGTHTVKLVYFPTGLIAGMIITVLCLLILLVLTIPALCRRAEAIVGRIFVREGGDGGEEEDGQLSLAEQRRLRFEQQTAMAGETEDGEDAPVERMVAQVRPVARREAQRDYAAEGFEAVDLQDMFGDTMELEDADTQEDELPELLSRKTVDESAPGQGTMYFRRENRPKR